MQLIDRHALLKKVYEHPQEREQMTDGEWCRKCIYEAPKVEADIDRAAILRLCSEIEYIVSEISKLSENYLIYSDCKSILDRTKAIEKELTGDAGSKNGGG